MPGHDLDARDLQLLEEVSAALSATDPVPDAVVTAARASLSWLTIDAELAALASDSAMAAGGVRGGTATRSLTFECATGVIVLEVSGDGDVRRIIGQTDRPADLEIRHGGAELNTETDEHGRFRVDDVQAGPVSVRCVFHDTPDSPIVTSWVVV